MRRRNGRVLGFAQVERSGTFLKVRPNSCAAAAYYSAKTHLCRAHPSCGWQAGGVWAPDSPTGRRNPSRCCSKVGGRCYSDSPLQCCSACCCLSSWSPSCRGCPCETHPQLFSRRRLIYVPWTCSSAREHRAVYAGKRHIISGWRDCCKNIGKA